MRCAAKLLLAALAVLLLPGRADAVPYLTDDARVVDLEYWAGEGPNEAIVVVDFNEGADDFYAFGYRWLGAATGEDALSAIADAGALDIETEEIPPWGTFLNRILYAGHETGDWPDGYLGYWIDDVDEGLSFAESMDGMGDRHLIGGSWDAWRWTTEPYGDVVPPPRIPEWPIPEPVSAALMVFGLFGLAARRRRVR